MTKRDREALESENNYVRTDHETKHLFIGGWQHFDMESFLKGRKKTYTTKEQQL